MSDPLQTDAPGAAPARAPRDPPATPPRRRRPHTLPAVIFEDSVLVVFDKPAGLPTARDEKVRSAENLMDIVHAKMSPDLCNVHRLDRDTSGVLVCVRNRPALRPLAREFEEHGVADRYLALVRGNPDWEETDVKLGIAPREDDPGKMRAVSEGGEPAETRFKTAQRWRGYALVEARPLTGRMHQIRVHLAALGLPVVADPLYGGGRGILLSELKPRYKFKEESERPLIGRVALHVESVAFTHPESGARIAVHAPLPHDFVVAIKYLDRFAK